MKVIYVNADASSLQGSLGVASQGTQIAGQLTNLLSGLVSAADQRKYMQAYQNLSSQQQQDLNQKIAATNDNNTKLSILVSALVSTKNQQQQQSSKNVLVYSVIGLGIILIAAVTIILIRKGKTKSR